MQDCGEGILAGPIRRVRSPPEPCGYTGGAFVYTTTIGKHLIDVDEQALDAARAELRTATIKDTVNEALRRAVGDRERRVTSALDILASARLDGRAEAWR
ncbi:MAG: hypothetical protein LC749_16655 [Actinobacteria bacterium]|nr:hypothetical protein [Actinomycetota bacterium]